MHEWQSLSHVRWECKYHVVIIPKFRRKVFYGNLRKQIGVILRELCRQRGVELLEGHCMADHIHMCLSIPPKYSVAKPMGIGRAGLEHGPLGVRTGAERLGEHHPPRQLSIAEKVGAAGAGLSRNPQPKQRDPDEIRHDHRPIDPSKTALPSRHVVRLPIRVALEITYRPRNSGQMCRW